MLKSYILSCGVGIISLSSLSTIFIFPSEGENSKNNSNSVSALRSDQNITRPALQSEESKALSDSSARNNIRLETPQAQIIQQPIIASEVAETPAKVSELQQKLPLSKTELQEWLENITPLFKNGGIEKGVKIVARWNSSYFAILEWNPKLQMFRLLNKDYGIWSNYSGYFTIAHKDAKMQEIQKNVISDSKCKNLDGFWYQNWHTWWKLSRWIRSFDSNSDGKAIASCSKDPITFLNVNSIIPTFSNREDSGWRRTRIENNTSVVWDHSQKRFVNLNSDHASNSAVVNNYEDWKKLFSIEEKK